MTTGGRSSEAEVFLGRAEEFESSGRTLEAAQTYAAGLKLHPSDLPLLEGYLRLLVTYGEDREAIKYGLRAVRQYPTKGSLRLILSQALTSGGRGEESREHLEAATTDPDSAGMAFGMLGYWYQARGEFVRARDCFEKSIAIEPRQSLSYYGWSQSNRLSNTTRHYLTDITAFLEEPGVDPETAMYLRYVEGKFRRELDDYEGSMRAYDLGNQIARQVNQSGRAFNRDRYQYIISGTIENFDSREVQRLGCDVPPQDPVSPIFIVGMMRSGTTLVEQILSSHPEVTAGGEIEFWIDSLNQIFDVDRKRVDSEALREARAAYLKILSEAAIDRPYVTDKMPQNFQALGILHAAFPEARIIHIQRKPIDNCVSIYFTPYQSSPDFAHDKSDIAFAYKEYLRLVDHWRCVLPEDRFLDVEYETLVADSEGQTRKILEFCGLPFSELCLKPQDNNRLVTTPSLWQVRQPVYHSSIDRWKPYAPWLGEFLALEATSSR